MPGSTPATSQLDWLISTTAITVLSWSRATRDLLKSFGWGIRALHQLVAATMVPSPRRLPHTISPLEGDGFELSVPRNIMPPVRRCGRGCRAPDGSRDPLRQVWSSIAPLADSRRLTLRLAVEGSPAGQRNDQSAAGVPRRFLVVISR